MLLRLAYLGLTNTFAVLRLLPMTDVARAYAGHTDSTGPATTNITASVQKVATALSAMTSQPHPLAMPPWTLGPQRPAHHPSA